MRTIILILPVLMMANSLYAVPTTYGSVYKDKDTYRLQSRYSNPHGAYHPRYPAHHYPNHRQNHIAVQTPRVSVYYAPPVQQRYEQTEEVYLPYGGTYRKTTQYQTVQPHARYPSAGVVLRSGQYYVEEE